MSNAAERALPSFSLSETASQVAEAWRQWRRSFWYYIDGKGITNAPRKTAQLVHLADMEVQDISEDLADPGPVDEDGDNEYVFVN